MRHGMGRARRACRDASCGLLALHIVGALLLDARGRRPECHTAHRALTLNTQHLPHDKVVEQQRCEDGDEGRADVHCRVPLGVRVPRHADLSR